MAHSYEAIVTRAARDLFLDAFRDYMESRGYAHLRLGGWLGALTAHEYRADDDLISVSISREGQSHYKIVVHSMTVHVEQLTLDAITEGMADFLEQFCSALTEKEFERTVNSLVKSLRDAFDRPSPRIE